MNHRRAYYSRKVSEFLLESPDSVLGELTRVHGHSLEELQRNAWLDTIAVLRDQLQKLPDAHLFLEFSIPRMGKRADAILFSRGAVFVLEFKTGATSYSRSAIDQVVDYAVDLSNFHEDSHQRIIVPVLVATHAEHRQAQVERKIGVWRCQFANRASLRQVVDLCSSALPEPVTGNDAVSWSESHYRPTPTIIEAAQALYRGHSVQEISRSDASAINLSSTARALAEIIEFSRTQKKRSICFVTGVPGAGKTLAGLNLACIRQRSAEDEHAVFLSGNGPLVDVLREALARNHAEKDSGTIRDARSRTRTFVQNIHHFRDDNLASSEPPVEKVVIFDEAQRAWDAPHLAKFMTEKKGLRNFDQSEPEFLISVMDRHNDWCTVVCLIGGGQEINSGEAGLAEWFSALARKFRHWNVWSSPQLGNGEYQTYGLLSDIKKSLNLCVRDELHLGVSLRSFRSEALSSFVHLVLENQPREAKQVFGLIKTKYPIYLTRDLSKARNWLRSQARGNELVGLLASSGALRLKAEGIHIKAKINAVDWFLNGKDDVRSCHYLEDAGTEFDVQGLELDWTCVCWDGDLRREGTDWKYQQFRGSKWIQVRQLHDQKYLKNAYRVLLTRARQGLVIFVPNGSVDDPTRTPEFYEPITEYLRSCGIEELS